VEISSVSDFKNITSQLQKTISGKVAIALKNLVSLYGNKVIQMENKELKLFTLDQIKDEFIGEKGTEKRNIYEQELQLELLGDLIKKVRLERNLTQEELGKLIGVQRAQISKLENNTTNVTIDTILRVFSALKAKVSFNVELQNNTIQIAG